MSGLSKETLVRCVRAWVFTNDTAEAASPALANFDPKNVAGGWLCLGHTSKENSVKITRSGGEVEYLDTAAEDAVDAATSAITRALEIEALQFDIDTLDLAYNGAYDEATGEYAVPSTADPLTKAVLVVMKTSKGKMLTIRGYGQISAGEEPTLDFKALGKVPLKVALLTDSKSNSFYWGGDAIKPATAPASEPAA